MASGLRERKKQQTLEALHDAALRLFDQQGFEATSVAEVAAEANVSPATFFNYFRSKEAAVWGDADAAIDSLRDALIGRPPATPALVVVREWVGGLLGWLEPRIVVQMRLATDTPQVAAYRLQILDRVQHEIANAVATDLGTDTTDLRSRLVSAIAVTAFSLVQELAIREFTEGGHFPARTALDDLLDDMIVFADAGLAALSSSHQTKQTAKTRGARAWPQSK